MGYYVVARRRVRRMPSPRLVNTGRQLIAHYLRLHDAILREPWAQALVPTAQRSELRSAIRSAALRLTVSSITRDSLQRTAIRCSIPAAILFAATVPLIVGAPFAYTAATAAAGVVVGAATLLAAAATGRALLHFMLSAVLAILGIAIEFPKDMVTVAAANALTAFCITPAVMYAAFLPMIIVAYGFAWRLARVIDPRARLIIGLLRCVHQISQDTRWLHDSRARDQAAASLEQIARIAERDLPRLLARRAQDPLTRHRLRENGQLIGTRIRECKHALILPDARSGDALPGELLRLLMHAAGDEWDSMRSQQQPPKTSGPLRRYAPHAATAIVLIAAGFALPEVVPGLKGAAGTNLRTVLLLSGFVALVPLERSGLNRIPDAFADAVRLTDRMTTNHASI